MTGEIIASFDTPDIKELEASEYSEETVNALNAFKKLKRSDTYSEGCSSCGDGSRFGVPLNWPIKLKLVPVCADVYNNADLLIAADCACFMYPKFHRDHVNGSVVFSVCPELNGTDIFSKLVEILKKNDFRSVTVAKMEAECCLDLTAQIKEAILSSGRIIPCQSVSISAAGELL